MQKHYAINIGRQLGSGGREIGEKLASRLGIAFYDKEIITLAAKQSGLCSEFFERADERAHLSAMRGILHYRFPFTQYGDNCLSNETLFQIQSDVIRELVDDHNCLFVGRCADYILRNHPFCVNIFISANREDRVKRIAEKMNVNPANAADIIERADKKRAEYYNYYTNKTWGTAASYHLCVNSSVLGIERSVEFIDTFVRAKLQIF